MDEDIDRDFDGAEPVDFDEGLEEISLGSEPSDASEEHFDNLAETLAPDVLKGFADDLMPLIKADFEARSRHDDFMYKGLKSLGIDREEVRTGPWEGASAVRVPLQLQSTVKFAARTKNEIFGRRGPIVALPKDPADEQSVTDIPKVVDYANRMALSDHSGFAVSFEQALLHIAISGTVVKKIRQGPKGFVAETIPSEDFAVPYSATSILTSPRNTHRLREHRHEVKLKFKSGVWKEIDLDEDADEGEVSRAQEHTDKIAGVDRDGTEDRDIFYESHCWLDVDDDGDEKPYIIVIHEASNEVVALYCNYAADDGATQPIQHFVDYHFQRWLGFWSIGLGHMIGGICDAATGALRSLLDSSAIENSQGGLINEAITEHKSGKIDISPLKWNGVRVPPNAKLSEVAIPFPTKTPSATMFSLLQFLVDQGDRLANVVLDGLKNANEQAPVGAVMAILEQDSQLLADIHRSVCFSFAKELEIIRRVIHDWMPTGGDEGLTAEHFDGRIRLVPAADPSTWSSTQRIMLAQTTMTIAERLKPMGVEAEWRLLAMDLLRSIGHPEPEKIFPEPKQPEPPKPMGPAEEFQACLRGQPVKAHLGQNHFAHVGYLQAVAMDPAYALPMQKKGPAVEALIADHAGMGALEEVYRGMGMMPPQDASQIPPEVVWQVAQAASEVAARVAQARRQSDPATRAAMQAAELEADIKLEKLRIEKMKLVQQGEIEASKIASNEKIAHAKLAADPGGLAPNTQPFGADPQVVVPQPVQPPTQGGLA